MKDSTVLWFVAIGVGLWVIVNSFGANLFGAISGPTTTPVPPGSSSAAHPVMNSLLSKPATPAPAGQQWQWNGFQWVTVPIGAIAM